MLSARENRLNYLLHKPIDRFMTFFEEVESSWQCSGFHERPPGLTSGYDWFGVYWLFDTSRNAFIPDHTRKPVLDDICHWREMIEWPDLKNVDWENAALIDGVDKKDRNNKVYGLYLGMGPFERLHSIMGFENALISLITEPEECKRYFEKWTEWKCELIHFICEYYKPDFIQFHDDIGTKNSSFCSPETWRNIIKFSWTACCAEIKRHGIPAELHSCGKGQDIFREVGDCGYDSLFIQDMNDIHSIREGFGRTVTYAPNGMTNDLEARAGSGGILADEVRTQVYDFVVQALKDSPDAFVLPVFAPALLPPEVDGETVLTSASAVLGVAWDWISHSRKDFDDILQQKQGFLKSSTEH
jgi:uroporphyrinogen decarboxylase